MMSISFQDRGTHKTDKFKNQLKLLVYLGKTGFIDYFCRTIMIKNLNIVNPKQKGLQIHNFYPYYAGFSKEFVESILISSNLTNDSIIIDPWNGSGTTTTSASNLGYHSIGYDLNPVMVIAARANLLAFNEHSSIKSLLSEICIKASQSNFQSSIIKNDPLCQWLTPSSANHIRSIERALQVLLVNHSQFSFLLNSKETFDNLSSIASFFYVGLFRTIRKILSNYNTSNPTWIKVPKNQKHRVTSSFDSILNVFTTEVFEMLKYLSNKSKNHKKDSNISIGSSIDLPIEEKTIDYILTSPPYCTRIDYAVATMPELALLGSSNEEFDFLRRQLIGTSKVPKKSPEIKFEWGNTCTEFLSKVFEHPSKASQTYYYKNHVQYFDSIFQSVCEIGRVLKSSGIAIIVVQDSYYKNIHNNLPRILIDMAKYNNLTLIRKEDFIIKQTLAGINSKSKQYRSSFNATESVLCFIKN